MKDGIQLFCFESHEVRVDSTGHEPLFVAADVCACLDIGNHRDAVARLDDDEKGVVSTDTPGGPQRLLAVTEPGLYELIRGSRKPAARRFQRWINHEVLPSIRKTGAYSVAGQDERLLAIAERSTSALEQSNVATQQTNALMLKVLTWLEEQKANWQRPRTIGRDFALAIERRLRRIASGYSSGEKKLTRSLLGDLRMQLRQHLSFFGVGSRWEELPEEKWEPCRTWLETEEKKSGRVDRQLPLFPRVVL